jgi:hypothetical protein
MGISKKLQEKLRRQKDGLTSGIQGSLIKKLINYCLRGLSQEIFQ